MCSQHKLFKTLDNLGFYLRQEKKKTENYELFLHDSYDT